MTAAEDKVKKLAKLKSNTICPNCGTEKKFGFGSVCIKFYTFVCNECKSSHQAISHRCKSITMSTWADQEVAELERRGNDFCRRTWLKNAPPCGTSGRPQSGSDMAVYKQFVIDAYEHKRFYGEEDGSVTVAVATPMTAVVPPPAAPKHSQIARLKPLPRPEPVSAPPTTTKTTTTTTPTITQDLLDFSSPVMPVAAPAASATIDFFADFASTPAPIPSFDAFAPTMSKSSGTNHVLTSQQLKNSDRNSTISEASAPFTAEFNGVPATSSLGNDSFQPLSSASNLAQFHGLSPAPPSTSVMKPPIMANPPIAFDLKPQGGGIMGPPPINFAQPYGQMPHYSMDRMQQQGAGVVMVNQQMNIMSGFDLKPNVTTPFVAPINGFPYGAPPMYSGTGGRNGASISHQFEGMSMNMNMNMNNSNLIHQSFQMAPSHNHTKQSKSGNDMPGGNVMDMLAYTQKKKK